MFNVLTSLNHWGIYFHYLIINCLWAFFTFTFTVSSISVSIPLLILFPIGFAVFCLSCLCIQLFEKFEVFLYSLYYVPNLSYQMIDNGESSIPLLQQEFSDQSTTLFDASGRPNRSTNEHQGIVAQMKDLISREATWTLMVYYSVYKLPSATIMFALTAVILTPLLNYFEIIPSSDIFLQFCHWLSISTSIGYLIWCGLSMLALPFILIICGQIYIMERRFLKVTQSNC